MALTVVHIALTPLAGSPIRIVNALNRYTAVCARLVVLNPYAYGSRIFAGDLNWASDKEKALELLREIDIVHLHHFFELDNNPFGINFNKVCHRARFVRQFHTHPITIARGDQGQAREIVNSTIPQLVISQYHERFYHRARVVPNIVPLSDELYRPITRIESIPVIFFAPTFDHSAWEVPNDSTRWDTKGAPETEFLLHRVVAESGKGRVVVRRNIPYDECLREKQASDIAVDEMVTGSYHGTGLEALAQGLPTFAHLDSRTLDTLAELTGTCCQPWLNFRLEEAERPLRELVEDAELRRALGVYAREWMETYYNDRDLVLHYVRAYEDLMGQPDKFRNVRFDPNSRRVMWFTEHRDEMVWESRRVQFTGRLGTEQTLTRSPPANRDRKNKGIAHWIRRILNSSA